MQSDGFDWTIVLWTIVLCLQYDCFDWLIVLQYDGSQYGINLISHPMNYTETQLDKELIRQIGIRLAQRSLEGVVYSQRYTGFDST